jgi:hypothetical protein
MNDSFQLVSSRTFSPEGFTPAGTFWYSAEGHDAGAAGRIDLHRLPQGHRAPPAKEARGLLGSAKGIMAAEEEERDNASVETRTCYAWLLISVVHRVLPPAGVAKAQPRPAHQYG